MIFVCKYCGDTVCDCQDDLDDEEVEIVEDVCDICYLVEECFCCPDLFIGINEIIMHIEFDPEDVRCS